VVAMGRASQPHAQFNRAALIVGQALEPYGAVMTRLTRHSCDLWRGGSGEQPSYIQANP
jgi:hypothetical protein